MGALEIRKTDSWQSLSIKNGKPETWSSICAVPSRAWKDGTLKVNFLTCACRWTDLRGWRGRSAGGRLDWHGPRGVGVRNTRGGGNLSGMGQNSATVSGCDWILMKCSRQTYVHMCLGSIPTKNSKDNTGKHKNVCNVSAFLPQGGSKCIQFNDLAPYWFFLKAILRIQERDGVTREDALRRLESQWPAAKQVQHANVVLSTLWEPEVTQKQVRHTPQAVYSQCLEYWIYVFICIVFLLKVLKAWKLLQKRIQKGAGSQ